GADRGDAARLGLARREDGVRGGRGRERHHAAAIGGAMRAGHVIGLTLTASLLGCTGCMERASLPVQQTTGPDPTLPQPTKSLIPTVKIAPAKGWLDGGKPVAADGMKVAPFAAGVQHPRWVYVLPNGDVLVSETSAPDRPEEG